MKAEPTAQRISRRLLAARLEIPDAVVASAARYYDLLQRWNQTINLTSLDDSDEAIDRLIVEPFSAAAHLPASALLMDIGSGGGSPAIPLALSASASRLIMVESRGRKAAFLREVLRVLDVRAEVRSERAETLAADPELRHAIGVVSLRAVRITAGLAEAIAELLGPQGRLIVFGRANDVTPSQFSRIAEYPLAPGGSSVLHVYGPVGANK